MKDEDVIAAGLAVRARNTGRVLMLQRAHDKSDPAGGMWEFPGGGVEEGESPLRAAKREWEEETGMELPRGSLQSYWESGIYRGHVWSIPSESQLTINPPHEDRPVTNPDDPDGDAIEAVAWWDPDLIKKNPSMRSELRKAMHLVQAAIWRERDSSDKHSGEIKAMAKTACCCPSFLMPEEPPEPCSSIPPGKGVKVLYAGQRPEDEKQRMKNLEGAKVVLVRTLYVSPKQASGPGFFGDYSRYLNKAWNPWSKHWGEGNRDWVDAGLSWGSTAAGAIGATAGIAAGGVAAAGSGAVGGIGAGASAIGRGALSAGRGFLSAGRGGLSAWGKVPWYLRQPANYLMQNEAVNMGMNAMFGSGDGKQSAPTAPANQAKPTTFGVKSPTFLQKQDWDKFVGTKPDVRRIDGKAI